MSNLQDLYKAIETLRKNNIPIDDNLSKRLDEAEEQIIRDEILPIIGKNIEPTLRQIQRKLVLVVDYDPSAPISVRMTRKRVITDETETKKYPLLPIEKPASIKKQKPHVIVNPQTRLKVTFPDGVVVQDKNATTTLLMAIEKIGPERVAGLGISVDKANLVSKTPSTALGNGEWHQVNDWYVNTHSNTRGKAAQLKKISKRLQLNLKIKIVNKGA
jgi:hypothetical protein